MASTAGVCTVYKSALFTDACSPGDTFKVALYNPGTLSASTTAYTSSGETSGAGYTAGGQTLVGFTVSGGVLSWTTNPSWTGSSFTASAALIYDSTSGVAVAVLTFASTTSSAGTWTLALPAAVITLS